MMKIKDFQLKWAHGVCRGNPNFVTGNKLLIPSTFFIKSCDLPDCYLRYHFEPGIRIGCFSTLPELGVIAVSERKANGAIYIFNYPTMAKISVLEQTNNEQYLALHFMCMELLLSLQIKNCYEIDVWKWQSRERVYFLSIPVLDSELPDISFSSNPSWWHQVLLQNNLRVILLEAKISDEKYTLDASSNLILADEQNKIELSVQNINSDSKDFHSHVISSDYKILNLQCACWLPDNCFLVATSDGILKVDHSGLNVMKLDHNKPGISSMILCKSGLYIGYKTGCIDIISMAGSRWQLTESVNIDQPIQNFFLSPDYTFLALLTVKGSIFFRDLTQGESSFKPLLRSECGGEIGVSFVGPLSHICATAKKNGVVHIFRTFDGKVLSTFKFNEEIVSMAASPLCYCIVLGTNVGFIYFIDVTDFDKPKIVHCEMPFDTPVSHLKFDNFGRFLFASAQNQAIKIWNGLPSSGFVYLGSKKITNPVKDIIAFSRTTCDETFLLILSERPDKERGSSLIRLKLPLDLASDSKKYHIDVFGTLSGDALNYQKRRLEKTICKLDAHPNFGVVFYSPVAHKVQSFPVWSDFSNLKPENVLAIKNANALRVSPNGLWMAITDTYGSVNLYSSKELNLLNSSPNYTTSENTCNSFIDFPLSSNNLICCRENGTITFYEWMDDSNILPKIPEWVVYCFGQSNVENNCLHSMEEEGRLELISEDSETKDRDVVKVSEIYKELELRIHIINFELDEFFGDQDVEEEFSSIPSILDEDFLEKLRSENRAKLSLILDNNTSMKESRKKLQKENAVKVLSSIKLGNIVQNYSKESIDRDTELVQTLTSYAETKAVTKSFSALSFTKTVKMKSKQERLETIRDLVSHACELKVEFNKEFENLYVLNSKILDNLNDVYFEAKRLSVTLPSKAERDFWNASILGSETGKFLGDTQQENSEVEIKASTKDSVEEIKESITYYTNTARNIRKDFDSKVEILVLKRRYCDYKIFRSEVKIFSILLFTDAEIQFAHWREETEKDIKDLEGLQSEIDAFIKAFSDIEKNLKDLCLEIQKMERNFTNKIETKCLKFCHRKEIVLMLKKQPDFQHEDCTQNPFWSSAPLVNSKDLVEIEKEFQISCPVNVPKADWESLCSKKIRVLKIGVIRKSLQNQAIIIANTKQLCVDAGLMLSINRDARQKALRDMSILISKLSMSFYSLITMQLENTDVPLVGDTNTRTKIPPSDEDPTPNEQIWEIINQENFRMQKVYNLLVEIGQNLNQLTKLKAEMCLKSTNIRSKNLDLVKDLKEMLAESKQYFTETKSVLDEALEGRKKNVFKLFKSRFLNETVNIEK